MEHTYKYETKRKEKAMRHELQKKIDSAIKLLRSASEGYGGKPIEVAYSGAQEQIT